MTLHPRAQAQVGSGLSLKRLERSCRRWQLKVCCWINEESRPLDMHQAISISPSKPIAPGKQNAFTRHDRRCLFSITSGAQEGAIKSLLRPLRHARRAGRYEDGAEEERQ